MTDGPAEKAAAAGSKGAATGGRKRPGGRYAQDSDVATPSQTLPVLTMLPDLVRKGFMVPAIATVVASGAALAATEIYHDPTIFAWVIGAYFTFLGVASVYALCGKHKTWLALAIVCVFTICAMTLGEHTLWVVAFELYHNFLAGIGVTRDEGPAPGGLIVKILQTSIFVGVMEEGFKIMPVALFALLAWQLTPGQRFRPLAAPLNRILRIRGIGWILDNLLVREPLDAILLAAASAAGFELVESLLQYQRAAAADSYNNVMGIIAKSPDWSDLVNAIRASSPALNKQFDELSSALATGQMSFQELTTTIIRTIDSPFGHIAFSGCVAYGIGLAMLRPRSAFKLIALYAAIGIGLHSVYDAVLGQYPDGGVLITLWPSVWALVAYVFLGTLILKARQISPTRASNFASVVARPVVHHTASQSVSPSPQPAPVRPSPQSVTVPPSPSVVPQPVPVPSAAFLLALPHGRVELTPDARLTERQLGYGGSAIAAEVNRSPHDARVLGLKNLSAIPWTATLPDGTSHTVVLDRSMRLIEGMTIRFGDTEGKVRRP